jgi:hypothetical protein
VENRWARFWSITDLRAFLSGSWCIDRTVVDRRHSIDGKLRGQADFLPSCKSLLYEERGRFTFGAHDAPAEQHYVFDFSSTDARASVKFRDGRSFHTLDLSQGEAVVSHLCGADLYEGHFMAFNDITWQSAWKVTGPRKNQDILTLYTRIE